jgi:hypothetical protein
LTERNEPRPEEPTADEQPKVDKDTLRDLDPEEERSSRIKGASLLACDQKV